MSEQAPTRRQCSPEQLERLARAREKALEKRQALAALKRREKELEGEELKARVISLEKREAAIREATQKPAAAPSKAPAKKARAPPPPREESETEEDSEEEEEEEEYAPPPPPPRRAATTAKPIRPAGPTSTRSAPQQDWMTMMRRVFPDL